MRKDKVMKSVYVATLVAIAFAMAACGTGKVAERPAGMDSVRVEYRTSVVYIPDTAFVEIPYVSSERTTLDSVLVLMNDYAVSYAKLNADGTLYGKLETVPHSQAVPTRAKVIYRDSVVYQKSITPPIIKEVNKLKWWQETLMWLGVLGMLVVAVWITIKTRK